MADPILSKVGSKPLDSVTEQSGAGTGAPKTGESKFDKVRAQMRAEDTQAPNLPPEVNDVSMQQKKVLQADLTKRIEQMGVTSPHQLFAVDMKRAKDGIQHLTTRVEALPKTPAFEPLRQRLTSIDAQFQAAGKLVNHAGSSGNPADMMKVQMQMYQLTENLELMSKVVDQVTSGVKSILQTQL